MEKPIIMHFHTKKDHTDFLELIKDTSDIKKDSFKMEEHAEAIVIEIINVN